MKILTEEYPDKHSSLLQIVTRAAELVNWYYRDEPSFEVVYGASSIEIPSHELIVPEARIPVTPSPAATPQIP